MGRICDNNNNNNNAICIAQIRRKQQMGCGQCPKRKAFSLALNVSIDMSLTASRSADCSTLSVLLQLAGVKGLNTQVVHFYITLK